MDREQLLCYLEAAVSAQYAMEILDQEKGFLLNQFEHKTPLRRHIDRENKLSLSFFRSRCQDILAEYHRLSCFLDDLYSYDIISENLHDPLFLPPCYALFATGKCARLEGPDSAYERLLDRPEPTTTEEYLRMEESIASLLNGSIRKHALPVNPIRARDALLKDILHGISAIARQLGRRGDADPIDTSPYAPALRGVDDWISLARACYSRWLSAYPDGR